METPLKWLTHANQGGLGITFFNSFLFIYIYIYLLSILYIYENMSGEYYSTWKSHLMARFGIWVLSIMDLAMCDFTLCDV